jgi:outer membrane protein assembly factor BamB
MSAFEGMESEIHITHVTRFYDTYVMLYDSMQPNHHTEAEVAVSDDGIHFRRVQNGVKLLPNGPPGSYDAGMICVSPRSLFEHDGKIWWYYTCSADTYQTTPRSLYNRPWHRYTGLAQWRLDGFASLRVADIQEKAEVVTAPLEIRPSGMGDIWLNAVASKNDGGIVVELLDIISDQVLAHSVPWVGDHLRGKLSWHSVLTNLSAGQKVKLKISFKGFGTKLYAIGVQGVSRLSIPTVSTSAQLMASDAQYPRIFWTRQIGGKISGSPCLDEETVYFGSWDHNIYALDRRTGELKWKYSANNAIVSTPVVHKDIVYFGSRDEHMYALKAEDGSLLWKTAVHDGKRERTPNGAWVDGTPAIGAWTCRWANEKDTPKRLYVGAHDRSLHCFDLNNGIEKWRFPTFNWILSRPAIVDYKVYFGSMDGYIYALDARCGALHWRYRVGKYLQYSPEVIPGSVTCQAACGSPLVVDGVVYCGADDGFIYALDANDSSELWTFQTGKWIWGRPLLLEGVLIVASADGRVYGLNAYDGKLIWRKNLGNANYSDVVCCNDLALVACTSGRLYAIDPKKGDIDWTFNADSGLRAAPAVNRDGTVYLTTTAGTIYALAGGESFAEELD